MDHRWSGWPGAWCLDCGIEDMREFCVSGADPSPECNGGLLAECGLHALDCGHQHHSIHPLVPCPIHQNPPCPGPTRADQCCGRGTFSVPHDCEKSDGK